MRYVRATEEFVFAGRPRPGFPLILDESMAPAQPFDGVAPALMLEHELDGCHSKLFYAKPPTQLHDESMGSEHCTLSMLEAVRHLDACRKSGRQLQPVKQLGSRAERAVERIEQMFTTSPLQAGAWQASYVGDGLAAESGEPVSERANFRHRHHRQNG